ncbi:methionine S-methyltransferase-like [Zingiber officinale]|uniref:methionine S-methyltransferase-like n=1 Tax=Zingiber officinale TaxID=94328 RepID=UPI001C4D9275|nr:methionine S-methyltransferase-like [Zingiber officinale]
MAIAMEIEGFLKECERSGDAAYAALKSLLEKLENPGTRSDARVFFARLQQRFDSEDAGEQCFRTYHFRIHDVLLHDFQGNQKRKKLTMVEIPSIFVPEDWSFTFYEGINRHPDSMFKDKTVTELGCGNGWISIALAQRWSPLKVYGLDINPRAVKISWINLFLNALDDNGVPLYDAEGKTLLDRVEFHESDLLGYCRQNKLQLERIIGCIPQILNPNPEAMSKMITENASEEFLFSLSNYCALQGVLEDQFGLGLIARAVEEGIEVIKPNGIMIFNIGGRPGQVVCKRLFERRGFSITKLWQTKIMQAADTDISALVEIEKNSHHRFEFFMGLVGDQPICARTAFAYAKSGGRISHALSVYSCNLRQPNQVKIIFDFIKNGFQELSSSLDLSFDNDSVADEKIPFLAYLASVLKENTFLPYQPPAGSTDFRNLIAGFMKVYHRIPITADNVTVFPSRSVAIENALRVFSPQLAIVDEHLTRNLPKQWLTSLKIEGTGDDQKAITVIEAPRQSDLMIELIKKLKPQVVITGMAQFEAITSSAFENLLNTTRDTGTRLFLDISDYFELSSLPGTNGVLKYLAGKCLPSHAAILCGLVKNQVYSDLEVAFTISEDSTVYKTLSKTVELMEGHTALFSQYYYGCIFHELLAFQLPDRHPLAERESDNSNSVKLIGFASSAISALNTAELSVNDEKNSQLIHMDVDQNFLPLPSVVKAFIFESFSRQNMVDSETNVRPAIEQLVQSIYGFQCDCSSECIFANSHLSLFNKLVLCCIEEQGTFLFPSGTNGSYVSAAKFMSADVVIVPTKLEVGFKLVPDTLSSLLGTLRKPWLYLCGPTVNPTGLLYSNNEIKEILSVCAKYGVKVVIDTSFSGLDFCADGWSRWDLQACLSSLTCINSSFCVSLLGGLSFELLTGGLEFGYLVLNDPTLVDAFSALPSLSRPHRTIVYAIKKLLGLRQQKSQSFFQVMDEQKDILKRQSDCLMQTLRNCGWDVISCHSGVSMVAKPTAYLGKMLKLDCFNAKLDDTNFREAMLKATGLCINSGSWTGIPNYCRLTFALDSADFARALECIALFKKLVLEK